LILLLCPTLLFRCLLVCLAEFRTLFSAALPCLPAYLSVPHRTSCCIAKVTMSSQLLSLHHGVVVQRRCSRQSVAAIQHRFPQRCSLRVRLPGFTCQSSSSALKDSAVRSSALRCFGLNLSSGQTNHTGFAAGSVPPRIFPRTSKRCQGAGCARLHVTHAAHHHQCSLSDMSRRDSILRSIRWAAFMSLVLHHL